MWHPSSHHYSAIFDFSTQPHFSPAQASTESSSGSSFCLNSQAEYRHPATSAAGHIDTRQPVTVIQVDAGVNFSCVILFGPNSELCHHASGTYQCLKHVYKARVAAVCADDASCAQ